MAHKTLINGTAYEISGGRTLVNGTAYSIDKGKTLVGGTVYEVGFGPAMCTITITRDYDGANSASVSTGEYPNIITYADGGAYRNGDNRGTWASPATIELPVGTRILIESEYEEAYVRFIVNGVIVYDGLTVTDYVWYEHIVTKNTTVAMTREWYGQSRKYVMTITEE